MVILEKNEFIEKSYVHSGRIPTTKGYKIYIQNIKSKPKVFNELIKKIDNLFLRRKEDINIIIDEAIKLISDSTNTLSITKENNNNSYIEDLKLYNIKNSNFLVVVVTSEGKVFNEEIKIKDVNSENLIKAFEIISQRIKGNRIMDLNDKSSAIFEILKKEIMGLEKQFKFFMEELIQKISNYQETTFSLNGIVSTNFFENKEKIKNIIEIVENKTIWNLIDDSNKIINEKNAFLLEIENENFKDISVIERDINYENKNKKLVFIGSKNQNYEQMATILNFLDDKLTNKKNGK